MHSAFEAKCSPAATSTSVVDACQCKKKKQTDKRHHSLYKNRYK